MWQEKRRFRAVDNQKQWHTIIEEVDMLDAGDGQEVEGLKRFVTGGGQRLNHISKGVYQTRDGGTTLTSTDPDAP
jgi:hypothetical protein